MRVLVVGLVAVFYASPSWAQFERMEDRQQDIAEERERGVAQADDTAKMREAMQENNILLKGIIIELRKQTELLDAISAEQKNQGLDLSRQTELLERQAGIKPSE